MLCLSEANDVYKAMYSEAATWTKILLSCPETSGPSPPLVQAKASFQEKLCACKAKFFVYMTRDLELVDIALYVSPSYHQNVIVRKLDKYSVPTKYILVLWGGGRLVPDVPFQFSILYIKMERGL